MTSIEQFKKYNEFKTNCFYQLNARNDGLKHQYFMIEKYGLEEPTTPTDMYGEKLIEVCITGTKNTIKMINYEIKTLNELKPIEFDDEKHFIELLKEQQDICEEALKDFEQLYNKLKQYNKRNQKVGNKRMREATQD